MTNYPSTLYVYPRQAGKRKDDGTCYYDRHYSWGSARDEWPDLCFQYLPDYDRKSNTKPGQLFTQEGWLVLDLYRKPIYDFRMPLALSSKTESFLLEAMLRDNYDLGIQVQDIRARMPGDQRKDGIRSATLSMQMSRWRAIAGCISWAPGRTASDTIRHYLDALLPQECLEANSTRGFRDLFPFEVQEMSLLNVGNFPQKARTANRNFSDKNKHKQKKFAEAVKKYEKLRMAHDGRDELTEAYHKAVATRAEREGRQDEETDIGDLVSIDGDNLEDSDNEKEYRPIKRRKTNRSVSNVGPRHDARHNSDDSENEEEYIPIFETSRPVLNTRPRRDARHAAALQNPDIEPKEYSSDDSEDYGYVDISFVVFYGSANLVADRFPRTILASIVTSIYTRLGRQLVKSLARTRTAKPNLNLWGTLKTTNPNTKFLGTLKRACPNAKLLATLKRANPNANLLGTLKTANPNANLLGTLKTANPNANHLGTPKTAFSTPKHGHSV